MGLSPSLKELNEIQFRLLGNDLGSLFLPDAVMFVEGETDKLYISHVLSIVMPGFRFVVESCSGNIAERLQYWASMTGNFQISPYRQRTFVIYDAVKQAGLERICDRLGIPRDNRIECAGNGIEFVYPIDVLSAIFHTYSVNPTDLQIVSDRVTFNDITYTKMQLANMVVSMTNNTTPLPQELQDKLIRSVSDAII